MPKLIVSAVTEYDAKGLKKASKDISAFDKKLKNLGKSFASVFAAQKLYQFSKASVKAFAADEKAAKALEIQLKNTGNSFATQSVENYIAMLQKTYGILDDELRPAFQGLLTATGSVATAQKSLGVALDVSAGTGKNLTEVTTALGKAYLGQTTSLSRLGAGLDKATLKTGDMDKILGELQTKFQGQALAVTKTYSGQMDKLAVASANAQEIIGKGLIDAITGLGDDKSVGDLADNMERLAAQTANVIRGIGVLAAKIKGIPLFNAIIGTFGDVLKYGPLGQLAKLGAASTATGGNGMTGPPENLLAISAASKAKEDAKKLADQRRKEAALIAAANKQRALEAQQKKEQAALDALKKKFDTERIGLESALSQAKTEEERARIKALITILDEDAANAQKAADDLQAAQKARLEAEAKATTTIELLAKAAGDAALALAAVRPSTQSQLASLNALNAIATPGSGADVRIKESIDALNSGYTPVGVGGSTFLPEDSGARNVAQKLLEGSLATDPYAFNKDPYVSTLGQGTGAYDVNVVVNAGVVGSEETIVEAVQAAIQTINRRGGGLSYAGALQPV